MTVEDAKILEKFVKDHDTRFKARAMQDAQGFHVQLTAPAIGKDLDPIRTLREYEDRYIIAGNPSPTVREAWDKWVKCQPLTRGSRGG